MQPVDVEATAPVDNETPAGAPGARAAHQPLPDYPRSSAIPHLVASIPKASARRSAAAGVISVQPAVKYQPRGRLPRGTDVEQTGSTPHEYAARGVGRLRWFDPTPAEPLISSPSRRSQYTPAPLSWFRYRSVLGRVTISPIDFRPPPPRGIHELVPGCVTRLPFHPHEPDCFELLSGASHGASVHSSRLDPSSPWLVPNLPWHQDSLQSQDRP